MASSAGKNIMEIKPSQDQINRQQALKCPRCNSSNTKFCYYNNYSLSQPRHFCKACKRYWTRGGTLRNVPVGGGCRKNKRVRSAASAAIDAPSSSSTPVTVTTSSYSTVQPQVEASSTPNHLSPLFFGINTSTSHSELALPYPRFSSRVLSGDAVSGYDLVHPQLSALGLRFSSGITASNLDHDNVREDYGNGFRPNKQTHDAVCNSNSLFSSYSMFGSSTSPTMASLLASSFHQQKYQEMVPYEDLQVQVKMEGQNRLDSIVSCQNQIEQISPSDPSLYWNSNWLDPSNIGSSVPSLI